MNGSREALQSLATQNRAESEDGMVDDAVNNDYVGLMDYNKGSD